jgi:hypothetical protein
VHRGHGLRRAAQLAVDSEVADADGEEGQHARIMHGAHDVRGELLRLDHGVRIELEEELLERVHGAVLLHIQREALGKRPSRGGLQFR